VPELDGDTTKGPNTGVGPGAYVPVTAKVLLRTTPLSSLSEKTNVNWIGVVEEGDDEDATDVNTVEGGNGPLKLCVCEDEITVLIPFRKETDESAAQNASR
jgi:hypothetical protein